jgi:nucleoside-diphosphate-sugar epimerase
MGRTSRQCVQAKVAGARILFGTGAESVRSRYVFVVLAPVDGTCHLYPRLQIDRPGFFMSAPENLVELHERASLPDEGVLGALRACEGDVAVLGAAGKMGFHLARMVQRGLQAIGTDRRVFAISRFSSPDSKAPFIEHGIETISCDLGDIQQIAALPECPNVFFLGGVKFGTANAPELLKRCNVEMPALVAARFRLSRIVALSTGCVYSYVTPESGGSGEDDASSPVGEYAKSCLGREQAFGQASENSGTRVSLIRLNYSVDLRYGVPVDIGQKVLAGQPVDVSMGYVNVVWQGDAVRHVIQALAHAASPPFILNVTGRKVLAVRDIATRLGKLFGVEPILEGEEGPTAWLNSAAKAHALFGPPSIDEGTLLEWVAQWLKKGGDTLNRPTHFETRDGNY